MIDAQRPAITLDVVAASVLNNKPKAVVSGYYCCLVTARAQQTVELAHSFNPQPLGHTQNWHVYQLTRPLIIAARGRPTDALARYAFARFAVTNACAELASTPAHTPSRYFCTRTPAHAPRCTCILPAIAIARPVYLNGERTSVAKQRCNRSRAPLKVRHNRECTNRLLFKTV